MSIIEQESWNYYRDNNDFEKRSYVVFETKSKSLLSDIENGLKTHTSNNSNDTENQDRELQTLLETNMKLLMEKDKKTQEYSQQMVQYQNLKENQQALTQGIIKTHEAFLLAKKYYKKHLKMYYTIDSKSDNVQIVIVQFFTESKKDSNNFSICLRRDTSSGCFEIISTKPMLPSIKEFQRKLQESKDLLGALCCIRQAFKNLNKNN